MNSARGWRRDGRRLLDRLGVGHGVDAAADPADPLGQHGDLVVGEDRVGQLLDPAMDHEAAVLAAAHDLALDEEPEVRGLVERRVEGPERHDRAALRRLVEGVLRLLVVLRAGRSSRARPCAAGGRPRASRRAGPGASGSGSRPARCRPGRASRARPSWRRARRRRCCRSAGAPPGRYARTLQAARAPCRRRSRGPPGTCPRRGRSSMPMLIT